MIFIRGQIIIRLPLVGLHIPMKEELAIARVKHETREQIWAGWMCQWSCCALGIHTGKPNFFCSAVIDSSQEFHDCTGGLAGRSPDMPIAQTLAVHVWREIGLCSNCCTNGGKHVVSCAPGKYTCPYPCHGMSSAVFKKLHCSKSKVIAKGDLLSHRLPGGSFCVAELLKFVSFDFCMLLEGEERCGNG